MGCRESKHAVATANTTVTKSKSKRSLDSNNVVPPLQNASDESVNAKENEIPGAVFVEKEAETTDNIIGKEKTLPDQDMIHIENGESTKEGDAAGGSGESVAKTETNDLEMKNEEGLKSEDAGNPVVSNLNDENKLSTSLGEDKTHVGEIKESVDATSTLDTKAD